MFSIDFISKSRKTTLNFIITRNTLSVSNKIKSTSIDLRSYKGENFGYVLMELLCDGFEKVKYSIYTLGNFLMSNILTNQTSKLFKLKQVSIGDKYIELGLSHNKWIHFLTDKYNYKDHNIQLSLNMNFE